MLFFMLWSAKLNRIGQVELLNVAPSIVKPAAGWHDFHAELGAGHIALNAVFVIPARNDRLT